jgi:glycosyltransferase involved in cell wall biosynthesis
METVRIFLLYGRSLFDDRYNIGWWPWELPVWPKAWHDAYYLVDEIWAATTYTADAYRKSAPMPVRNIPLAVSLKSNDADTTHSLGREHFGLPKDTYLFYFAFDFNSTLERKNPWACLRAFQLAFPSTQTKVGLVIKVMHTSPNDTNWCRLQAEIMSDPRIILINKSLRRSELLALYGACDCYVSLHRAEGFGRGAAEAMLLGQDIIVSDYSGTRDFAKGPKVHPVKGIRIRIKRGDYPGATGREFWFDANVADAAQKMASVAQQIKQKSLAEPEDPYCRRLSVDFVAEQIKSALTEITQNLTTIA